MCVLSLDLFCIICSLRQDERILSLQESMQLPKRVKDNQSLISIAMQVELVTMGRHTMLQPVINMVRYDGTLVSDISSNPAATFDFIANWYSHIHFNAYLFLYFYSVTAVLSEITIMLLCSICHTQFSSGFALRRRLGCWTVIPHDIKKKKCINSVNFDGNKKYTDNLCFFRCLYLKLHCKCKDKTRKRCACLRKSSSVSATLDLLNHSGC